MFHIIHPDLFTMKRTIVKRDHIAYSVRYHTMVQFQTRPKHIALPHYRETPFATAVLHTQHTTEHAKDSSLSKMLLESPTYLLSEFGDESYEEIEDIFSEEKDLPYNNSLFDSGTSPEPSSLRALLLALPIQGILSPVLRSNWYKLYNGSLVLTKPFEYEGETANKIVYLMATISAPLVLHEFLPPSRKDPDSMGSLRMHTFGISSEDPKEILYTKETYSVPYEGNESLFRPGSSHNLFLLSDIPPRLVGGSLPESPDPVVGPALE